MGLFITHKNLLTVVILVHFYPFLGLFIFYFAYFNLAASPLPSLSSLHDSSRSSPPSLTLLPSPLRHPLPSYLSVPRKSAEPPHLPTLQSLFNHYCSSFSSRSSPPLIHRHLSPHHIPPSFTTRPACSASFSCVVASLWTSQNSP